MRVFALYVVVLGGLLYSSAHALPTAPQLPTVNPRTEHVPHKSTSRRLAEVGGLDKEKLAKLAEHITTTTAPSGRVPKRPDLVKEGVKKDYSDNNVDGKLDGGLSFTQLL